MPRRALLERQPHPPQRDFEIALLSVLRAKDRRPNNEERPSRRGFEELEVLTELLEDCCSKLNEAAIMNL